MTDEEVTDFKEFNCPRCAVPLAMHWLIVKENDKEKQLVQMAQCCGSTQGELIEDFGLEKELDDALKE